MAHFMPLVNPIPPFGHEFDPRTAVRLFEYWEPDGANV